MAAPGRVSEVLKLPIDCIQWEEDDDGNLQMFLRWNAAKGKGATKKWVVPVMHDVVKEAVRRLIEIGAPARELVRAAFEGSTSSSEDVGTSNLIKEFGGFYWPFLDEKRVLTTWSALCLHRENEFSREKEIRPDSWRIPSANEVNKRLALAAATANLF